MARARTRGPVTDDLPPGTVAEVEGRVRAAGALPARRLVAAKLGRRAEVLLREGLARRGLEVTAKVVRVALPEQLRALLAAQPSVPAAGVARRLKGASAKEAAGAVAALLDAGEAVVVARGGKDHLARPSGETLRRDEIARLQDAAQRLSKLMAATKPRRGKPPRTLWRADVDACVHDLAPPGRDAPARETRTAAPVANTTPAQERATAVPRATVAPARETGPAAPVAPSLSSPRAIDAPVAPARTAAPNAADVVVAAVQALQRPGAPLVFVPDVVRALEAQGVAAPQRALLAAAAAGGIELRPESGVGLLGAEDAARCPRGPTGVPLSYARILGR
ncbi:MAG TPA: hypothetical protein VG389_11775 [Myxococcota bacterium]|jgi:hypothetical protein|nr:hypothetical protein [Myxococcota bacterium]